MSGLEFLYLSLAGGGGRRRKTPVSKWFQKKFWHGVPLYFDIFQCEKEGKQHLKYVFQLKF